MEQTMSKDYKHITHSISRALGAFKKDRPDVMEAFSALAQAASKEGALDKKTKELIALALGVSAHCEGCIGFHAQKLVQLGASREELMETLSMAVYMGGGPSLMYAAEAIDAFETFQS